MAILTAEQSLIDALNLPSCLVDRILCRVPSPPIPPQPRSSTTRNSNQQQQQHSCVLYLPTVVLRKHHNPAFALACHLANHYGVPLVVLVTVLDDQHLSRARPPLSPVTMTARRLAFLLEGLQSPRCCPAWETHGAGVAIRVHGPGNRTPHHLSLCGYAAVAAVVSDEPFVDPYRQYVRNITKTCRTAGVPFYTVDGSTSVPPNGQLVRRRNVVATSFATTSHIVTEEYADDLSFVGAPSKAWRWEKQTAAIRQQHVDAAYHEHQFEAPELISKLPPNFFLGNQQQQQQNNNNNSNNNDNNNNIAKSDNSGHYKYLLARLPLKWKDHEMAAPGQRPFTVLELGAIADCKAWAMTWHGADASVPPCAQTHGSYQAAKRRWRSFSTHTKTASSSSSSGLKDYAKQRNGIGKPHAVSRMSCYLNLGIVSIFEILQEVWEIKTTRKGYATGCNKFLDEVIKWREGSYVHAFAHPNYHTVDVLPLWSRRYLESQLQRNKNRSTSSSTSTSTGYDYKELERAATTDATWNAMQKYLIDTGELHNNARMTWGKTVVHWQASRVSPEESLWQLCCLNDRFALDGLSPPSYGGVLWCYGWQDKPSGGNRVSEKWAHRYRAGPRIFAHAREQLLIQDDTDCGDNNEYKGHTEEAFSSMLNNVVSRKRTTRCNENEDGGNSDSNRDDVPRSAAKKTRITGQRQANSKSSILSYFSPKQCIG